MHSMRQRGPYLQIKIPRDDTFGAVIITYYCKQRWIHDNIKRFR